MNEAVIESGFAKVEAGTWLTGRAQPAAWLAAATVKGLKGFIVPDRAQVQQLTTTGTAWLARSEAPFLTRLDALPDAPLKVVSSKVLVAPFEAREGAQALKLVPYSFQRALPVTRLRKGWAVMATSSRTVRVTLEDGATLSVRPEALVAWMGSDPTGFCPRLTVWDMLLPRGPKNLVFTFHGPAVVWSEGSSLPPSRRALAGGRWRRGGAA